MIREELFNDSDSEFSGPRGPRLDNLASYMQLAMNTEPLYEQSSVASNQSLHSGDSGSLQVDTEADAILVEGIMEAESMGMDCLVQLLRGQKYLLEDHFALAATHLESALDFYLRGDCDQDISIYVYTLLMDAYFSQGHFTRCISVAKEQAERFPKSVTAHAALAHVLFAQGQYEDCIAACTSAITKVEECEGIMAVYNTRGNAYLKKGLHKEAVQDFESVKTLGQKKGLMRFTAEKQPFLVASGAFRTFHLTPHSERRYNTSVLLELAKRSGKNKTKDGAPSSPDCSPLADTARKRGKERHFAPLVRQRSIQRILNADVGKIF